MSAQHTPGPWLVRATPESSNQDFIVSDGKYAVASIDYCDESDANACLIAAAPELLKALDAAIYALRSFQHGNGSEEFARDIASHCAAVRDKATGSTA